MPIYDQGYQRWTGQLRRHPVRWWPILRRGFLDVIRQRKYLLLLSIAWLVHFYKAVRLFLNTRVTQFMPEVGSSRFLETGNDFFYGALRDQGLFILLFVVFVGSDLIARDRRYNALQLYFSKPLTSNDYILGKLGIVGSILLMITWVPVLLLWLFGLSVETRPGYFAEVWSVPLATTAYCVVLVGVAGMLMLALSAAGRRAVFIALTWLIVFGWGPMGFPVMILQALTGRQAWGLVHLSGNVDQLGAWFFGVEGPYRIHPLASLVVAVAVVAACYALLRRKIAPVEVVL